MSAPNYDGNDPDRFLVPWFWARTQEVSVEFEGATHTVKVPALIAVYEDRVAEHVWGYAFHFQRGTFLPCIMEDTGAYAYADSAGTLLRVVDREDLLRLAEDEGGAA